MASEIVATTRAALRRAADPAKAPAMRAYMKSAMPFLGVQAQGVKRVVREAVAAHPLWSADEVQATVLTLWREAKFREERYAALGLAHCYRRLASPATLAVYEELVVAGAWWDLVDSVAHLVGDLLRRFPADLAPAMRAWSRDDDPWKRRVSIICQLGRRGDTDLELLYACIEPNLAERDFFIRKAIGWALRDYAWHNPREVERYVRAHTAVLSPLSRREATKNLARLLS